LNPVETRDVDYALVELTWEELLMLMVGQQLVKNDKIIEISNSEILDGKLKAAVAQIEARSDEKRILKNKEALR